MGFWDVSGDLTLDTFVSEGELDNTVFHPVDGPTSFAINIVGELDNQENAHELSAAVAFELTLAAEILNGGQPGIDAPVALSPFSSNGTLRNYAPEQPVDGAYTELRDPGLLGAWQGCSGPGDTVVIAGLEARQLVVISHADTRRLRVIARTQLDARPVGITSTKRMPPWDDANGDDADQRVFVALEQAESANGVPRVQCRQMTVALPLLSEVELLRSDDPPVLWGPEDDAAASFIVVAHNGGMQIRAADETLEVLAEAQTDLYRIAALDVRRREDLETTGVRVWHVLAFSHTGAQGAVLEYREIDTTKQVTFGSTRIAGDAQFAAFASEGEIQQQVVREMEGAVATDAFAASGEIQGPPTGIAGAVSLRPFSQDNTGAKHINAIEQRVAGDLSFSIALAGDVEIV